VQPDYFLAAVVRAGSNVGQVVSVIADFDLVNLAGGLCPIRVLPLRQVRYEFGHASGARPARHQHRSSAGDEFDDVAGVAH